MWTKKVGPQGAAPDGKGTNEKGSLEEKKAGGAEERHRAEGDMDEKGKKGGTLAMRTER
jgi:hypothetical protein